MHDPNSLILATGSLRQQKHSFRLMSMSQLANLCVNPVNRTMFGKAEDAKEKSPWFIPCDCTHSKKKADLEVHNRYNALVIDLDSGNFDSDCICDTLESFSVGNYIGYSSARSSSECLKWRIVIPLLLPVNLSMWQISQRFLVGVFGSDVVTYRIQQIAYLPVLTCVNCSGFRYFFGNSGFLDLGRSDLYGQAYSVEQERLRVEAEEQQQRQQAVFNSPYHSNNKICVIKAYNQSVVLHDLLLSYGYVAKNGKYYHPEISTSGNYGGIIRVRDGVEKFFTNNGSENLSDGYYHDAFDVYLEHEPKHKGNRDSALTTLGDTLFLDSGLSINQHNRRVYRDKRRNDQSIG